MAAVFDHEYVKRIDGSNKKCGEDKTDLAKLLMADIVNLRRENNCARIVEIWCGPTETFKDL